MSDNHLTQESVSRRQFLKGSTAAMGGLMVGAWLPPFAPKAPPQRPSPPKRAPWVTVLPKVSVPLSGWVMTAGLR